MARQKKAQRKVDCVCKNCNKHYVYDRDRKSGSTLSYCASCQVNMRKDKLKKELVAHHGGECVVCGYSRCLRALCFHHLDPEQKTFNISGCHSRSREVLFAEAEKCILICSNCHAEIEKGITNGP